MEVCGTDRRSIAERLKATTDELQKLEKLVISGGCAPRVLCAFRDAVDSIRQTAWAVQQVVLELAWRREFLQILDMSLTTERRWWGTMRAR
jgi:hypothetical protein